MAEDAIVLNFSSSRGEIEYGGISFIKYSTVKKEVQKDPRLIVKCLYSIDELYDSNKLTDEEVIEIYNDNMTSLDGYDDTLKFYTVNTSEEGGCFVILPGTDLYKIVASTYKSDEIMYHMVEMLLDIEYEY